MTRRSMKVKCLEIVEYSKKDNQEGVHSVAIYIKRGELCRRCRSNVAGSLKGLCVVNKNGISRS